MLKSVAQYSKYRQKYFIIVVKSGKRLDLNNFYHKKEMTIMWHDRVLLPYTNVSNQYVIYVKQCLMINNTICIFN